MATLKGKAVVWAVGSITYSGITIGGNAQHQSATFRRQSEARPIRDSNGETCGMSFFDHNNTLSITVVPSASSVATARGDLTNMLASPGTVVSLTGADVASLNTLGHSEDADAYLLLSSEVQLNNEQEATVVMELQQFVANEVTAATT